ncbi:MAG: hypothetical protein WCJ61_06865 [Paludibacter sp.]
MTKEELEEIVVEFREKSSQASLEDETEAAQLDRFADWVESDIENFDDVEDKEELWELFLEVHDEEAVWDAMFPDGDDDDSITDYLTKD